MIAETLSVSEVEKISSWSIKNFDKWNRMCAGISSRLERYENGIIYLRIENTEKKFPSNNDIAVKFSREWVKWNEELKDAKGSVVSFYKTRSTGCMVEGDAVIENKNMLYGLLRSLIIESKEEKELVNVFSGLFSDK